MLQYPWLRENLINILERLADPTYPRRAWVNHQFPPGIEYDCFDYTVHFLFDDTTLADDPNKNIGWILENEAEAGAITKVTGAIDHLLNELGTELTDEEYITSEQWPSVVDAANQALAVLNKKPA